MNRPIFVKLLSGIINILACLIVLAIVLFRQDWFGKGDTYAFIFWTIPLAIGMSVTGQTILNLFKTRIALLRLLLILLTAGIISFGWVYFIFLILGQWINTFSFPIFYLWIIGNTFQLVFLDWRLSKRQEEVKTSKVLLRLLLFPLILIIVVVSMFLFSFVKSYLTRPEKETFLIPEGYKGNVFVIFNQPDGEKPEYKDGRRIYRIPQTGVLFTQLNDEYGLINQEYFYISPNGLRRKLGVLDTRDFNEEWTLEKNPHEPPRDSLAVFNPGTMGTMGNSNDKNSKVYSALSVGTYNDLKNSRSFSNDYIDSLQMANRK